MNLYLIPDVLNWKAHLELKTAMDEILRLTLQNGFYRGC